MAVSHRTKSSTGTRRWVREQAKHALAMAMFLAVLIGGGAAAFSLLAAGISALSNVSAPVSAPSAASGMSGAGLGTGSRSAATTGNNARQPQLFGSAPTTGVPAADSGTRTGTGEQAWTGTTSTTGPTVIDQLNNDLNHMNSPIIGAIDTGGVTVGNRVQGAFGRFLAGLINTLFLEQSDSGSSSSAASGQTATP